MYRGNPIIPEEEIPDLFLRWLRGESLRKISKGLGCKHQSLHERFAKKYGNLGQHRHGLFRIIEEDYFGNQRYSKKEKEFIKKWFKALKMEDLSSNIDLFSEKELKNYTTNYCGYSGDFRDVFTNQKIKGQIL
jgi:hypothetical protein